VSILTHSPILLVFCKAQEWFCRNLRPGQSSLLPLLLEWPLDPSALSLPSLHSFLLSSALLPSCLSWTPWASPHGPCTSPSLCVEQPLQVCLSPSPSPGSAHPPLSRALTPQCGLTSLLYSPTPWAHFLFLLILSTCTQVNFPYCSSPTVDRNSMGFVPSWPNSLCPEQCLVYIDPQ